MADATDTPAPARRSASRSARSQETLEDQVAKLQDDIKSIATSLAKLGDQKVDSAKVSARKQYRNLVNSGQSVVDEISGQVNAYEGQLVDAIREKPLTAVLGAIGVGYLIAMLSRR